MDLECIDFELQHSRGHEYLKQKTNLQNTDRDLCLLLLRRLCLWHSVVSPYNPITNWQHALTVKRSNAGDLGDEVCAEKL